MAEPSLWERDNCPCPRCVHPSSHERLVMVIDPGDGPHHTPEPSDGPDPALVTPVPPAGTVARLPYDELDTAAGLERFLVVLLEHGVAVVTGTPTLDGEVGRVAERIGFVRPTNFGALFDVVSMPRPNSNAYTSVGLDLHTDLPYWAAPPDFQLLLAMVADAEGGASTLADGIAVAARLRATDPEAFAVLATWPVPFRFVDDDHDIRLSVPVVETVGDDIVGIRFNNGVRATDPAARGPEGERFYAAYLTYWRMLRAAAVSVRLDAGDLLVFDNRRMLHGRAPFDPSTGERRLQGCYLDRDMVHSALRTLRSRLPA